MTSGLDDVIELIEILQNHKWQDFPTALKEYSDIRVPENNAATELNYVPMIENHPLYMAMEAMRSLFACHGFAIKFSTRIFISLSSVRGSKALSSPIAFNPKNVDIRPGQR